MQVEGCHREGIGEKVHPRDEPNAFWVKLSKGVGSYLWDILGWTGFRLGWM